MLAALGRITPHVGFVSSEKPLCSSSPFLAAEQRLRLDAVTAEIQFGCPPTGAGAPKRHIERIGDTPNLRALVSFLRPCHLPR